MHRLDGGTCMECAAFLVGSKSVRIGEARVRMRHLEARVLVCLQAGDLEVDAHVGYPLPPLQEVVKPPHL